MNKEKTHDKDVYKESPAEENIDNTPEEYIDSEQQQPDNGNLKDIPKKEEEKKEEPAFAKASADKEEELKKQVDELNDKYLRLFAEFDNFKKRSLKERSEFIQYAGQDVITGLLPVLDDFERALQQIEEAEGAAEIKEGIKLIYNKLKNILEQKGLKEMQSIGEEFNPDYHEAVTQAPAPSEDQKGKVIEELEKGYYLKDKIVRYAKVIVGK